MKIYLKKDSPTPTFSLYMSQNSSDKTEEKCPEGFIEISEEESKKLRAQIESNKNGEIKGGKWIISKTKSNPKK